MAKSGAERARDYRRRRRLWRSVAGKDPWWVACQVEQIVSDAQLRKLLLLLGGSTDWIHPDLAHELRTGVRARQKLNRERQERIREEGRRRLYEMTIAVGKANFGTGS